MKKYKVLALLLCFAMVLSAVLPGTLAVSSDEDSTESQLTVETDPQDETPEDNAEETPAEDSENIAEDSSVEPDGETPTDDNQEDEETEGESELTLFERLMATETAEEFDAIVALCTEDELFFSCEEFDALDAHYIYLTTGEYPNYEPVVYVVESVVSETVNFTDVAPLVGSGE